ncbi:MAG: glycosyltransferase family 2 protein [Rivularia sp. (in: cyanobacteria)]
MPKISIIIPAYNAMSYLPETLESVFGQTFTDFEILIINDGSSDDIVEWVSQITESRLKGSHEIFLRRKKFGRVPVKLISQANQGVSAARNTGIRKAQGEYIAFLDADDLWGATKLEKQVVCLDNNPTVGLVYTWTAFIDQFSKPTGVSIISQFEGNVWEKIVVRDMISTGSCTMIRAECFDKVGLFDSDLWVGEDRDMWTRIAACYPFAVIKEPLTLYRRHPQNTTKSNKIIIPQLSRVIEKTFRDTPENLLYLKKRSYGWMNIFAAWCAIDEEDHKQATYYRQQAVQHYPQLLFTLMHLRLLVVIIILTLFGPQTYDKVRGFKKSLSKRIAGIVS